MHRPGKAGKHLANATEVQNRNMPRVSDSLDVSPMGTPGEMHSL